MPLQFDGRRLYSDDSGTRKHGANALAVAAPGLQFDGMRPYFVSGGVKLYGVQALAAAIPGIKDAGGGKFYYVDGAGKKWWGAEALVQATASPAIIPTTGILVANRGMYHTASVALTAPATYRKSYWAHPDGAISNIKTVDLNRWAASGQPATTYSAGAAHDIKRYIEYPAGVFYPVTWSGAGTVTVASGARLVSDAVAGLTIPAGAQFWIRTVYLTSGTFPVMELPANATTIGVDDGSVSSDSGNSGTIPASGSVNSRGCQAIIGDVAATAARSFVIIGDSLTSGTGDTTSCGPLHSSGWVARLLDQHGWPYMKWGRGGQSLQDQVTVSATMNADLALFGFSDVIIQSGINDLSLQSRTKAQIEADIQTIIALSSIAGKRIWKATIGPRTTSTDAWATLANQTPAVDGNMADLTGLNADIRAGLPGIYGVLEMADAAMSARDSNLHKAPPAGTADGVHVNSARAALIASLLSMP